MIYTGRIGSLRRFKEDVPEVRTGFECGMGIANFNDVKVGDILECFTQQKIILAEAELVSGASAKASGTVERKA